MTNKMDKDPANTAFASGCTVGCGTFILFGFLFSEGSSESTAIVAFFISIAAGLIAFFITQKDKTEESNRENREVEDFVKLAAVGSEVSREPVDQSIKLMCRATYYGGHKKYEDKVDVSFVLTKDRILIKELPGHAETRIDIPYHKISDFGLATKEQLTVTRMLLVGILAFALKKKERYLYVKYTDSLGFELNPVFGEFVGAPITNISSQMYTLIEQARKA